MLQSVQYLFLQPLKVLVHAEVAHLVEHNLAKVGVAGSSPVFRSEGPALRRDFFFPVVELEDDPQPEVLKDKNIAPVVELVDTQDLKSCDPQRS